MEMPATKTTICLRQKKEHKREDQSGRKITVRITSISPLETDYRRKFDSLVEYLFAKVMNLFPG
jgi:hypothetical protein